MEKPNNFLKNRVINEVCDRCRCLSSGCSTPENTHKICKLYNLYSYNKLNKLFE